MTQTDDALSDTPQREEALKPASSFIVQAPAGSGKTGILVQRILRLLGVVRRPECIVAMTFTRKAAAEMKERVLEALQQANDNAPVGSGYQQRTRDLAVVALRNDREQGWNLLADTSRLHIQTIDALCAMLTRQMPVVSEFGGTRDVVEDARELCRTAARRTIRTLAEGDQEEKALFKRLALHFDNDVGSLERQIAGMLQKRDQWRFLRSDHEDGLVADFCSVLHFASEHLKETFGEYSAVDFTEVTRAAIKALGTSEQPSDLLYWLDYRIEHLLVDEFQDTSRAQYDLIEALTAQWSGEDGHTLFVVGDPMQSIYRFREAEVSLFLRSWEEERLGSVRLHPLRLSTNFRSTPEIVEWTQTTLAAVMSEDDRTRGAVKLQLSEASRPKSKVEPQVIALLDDPGAEEARQVVRIVEQCRGKDDIAILVRSRAHIVAILPALRKADIAYEAIEIDELREQQHILDVISLTRALLHVADRVSWLACLRAPWCGLTLLDLSALAEHETERTIPELLSDTVKIAQLTPDGRTRAVRVQEVLHAAVLRAGRVPLRDLVEQTWLSLGGSAVLRESNQIEDIGTYLNLLEDFEQGGTVRDFSLLDERLECLYAKPRAVGNCVRVMTIHQAKGLEFDVVIIPKLASPPKRRDNELLIWTETVEDGDIKLHLAAQPKRSQKNTKYDFVCNEIAQKEAHELKRLFYVACTRAKNGLYLIGNVKTRKARTEMSRPGSKTFLGLIWSSVEHLWWSELRRRVPVQASLFSSQSAAPVTVLRRLPAAWRAPQLEASIAWQPEFGRTIASARAPTYSWVGNTTRHIGTVVHNLLKHICRDGVDAWTPERVQSFRAVIDSELSRLGVLASEQPQAAAQVLRALSNSVRSERGTWVLRSRKEAHADWAISGRIGDQLIAGVIDRAFRDEQGRFWIVDFKTSEHEGSRLEHFLDKEQERYRPQLEKYGTLLSRLEKGPIWLGLYFPLLDAWREWQLEQAAALTA